MSTAHNVLAGEGSAGATHRRSVMRLWLVCIEAAVLLFLSIGVYSGVVNPPHRAITAIAWFPSALKSAAFAALLTGAILMMRQGWRAPVSAFLQRRPPAELVAANIALFLALAGWLLWTPPLREVAGSLQDGRTMLYLASPLAWLAFCATSALILFSPAAILRALTPRNAQAGAVIAAAMFAYFAFGLPIDKAQSDALIRLTVAIATPIYGLLGGTLTFRGYGPDGHPIYAADSFVVSMQPSCSGAQGMILVTLIALLFVALEHRRLRIHRVLVLVPLLALLMFLINAVRIAVLLYIGARWSPEIAINGFHGNFGVISLAVVSIVFVAVVQAVPAFTNAPSPARAFRAAPPGDDQALSYLLPLLVLIGVSLFTGLFTGAFHWLYPIHITAAAIALYWSRDAFIRQFGEVSLLAVGAGVLVFVLWIALIAPNEAETAAFAATLYGAPAWAAALWLLFRLVGSVVVVPLAEELAFRGFLQPFLAQQLKPHVSERLAAAGGLAGASIMFGIFHADIIAGALAGVAYGLVYLYRQRLGDAIIAHGVTNLLIALYALVLGQWSYW